MSDMIEKIARALYDAQKFKRGWDNPKINPAWKPHYRKQAKVAIKAYQKWQADE